MNNSAESKSPRQRPKKLGQDDRKGKHAAKSLEIGVRWDTVLRACCWIGLDRLVWFATEVLVSENSLLVS